MAMFGGGGQRGLGPSMGQQGPNTMSQYIGKSGNPTFSGYDPNNQGAQSGRGWSVGGAMPSMGMGGGQPQYQQSTMYQAPNQMQQGPMMGNIGALLAAFGGMNPQSMQPQQHQMGAGGPGGFSGMFGKMGMRPPMNNQFMQNRMQASNTQSNAPNPEQPTTPSPNPIAPPSTDTAGGGMGSSSAMGNQMGGAIGGMGQAMGGAFGGMNPMMNRRFGGGGRMGGRMGLGPSMGVQSDQNQQA